MISHCTWRVFWACKDTAVTTSMSSMSFKMDGTGQLMQFARSRARFCSLTQHVFTGLVPWDLWKGSTLFHHVSPSIPDRSCCKDPWKLIFLFACAKKEVTIHVLAGLRRAHLPWPWPMAQWGAEGRHVLRLPKSGMAPWHHPAEAGSVTDGNG